jgi:hypothetical protein
MSLDDLFATLRAAADARIEQYEKRQRYLRDARNARRRERYAARRERYAAQRDAGATAPVVEPEPEPIRECCCHMVAMPPCSWCESGAGYNDAEG